MKNEFLDEIRKLEEQYTVSSSTTWEEYASRCFLMFEMFQSKFHLRRRYVRDSKKFPVGVVVYKRQNGQIYVGSSYCSPRDSKKYDKYIGLWKAVKNLTNIHMSDNEFPRVPPSAKNTFMKIVEKTRLAALKD